MSTAPKFSAIAYLARLFLDFKTKDKTKEQIKKAIILKSVLLVLTIAGLIIGLTINLEDGKEFLRMFIMGWWIIPIFFKLIFSALKKGNDELNSTSVVNINLDNGTVTERPSVTSFIILIVLLLGAVFLFMFASVVLTLIYIPLLIAQLIVHIVAFVKFDEVK